MAAKSDTDTQHGGESKRAVLTSLVSPSLAQARPFCTYLFRLWRFFWPPSANLHSKGSDGAADTHMNSQRDVDCSLIDSRAERSDQNHHNVTVARAWDLVKPRQNCFMLFSASNMEGKYRAGRDARHFRNDFPFGWHHKCLLFLSPSPSHSILVLYIKPTSHNLINS